MSLQDRPPRPLRYSPALLHARFILLSIALMLILVVAGMAVFLNQGVTRSKSALVATKATKTLVPTPTTIHTPAPTLTPSPTVAVTPTSSPTTVAVPTSRPTPTPTATPTPASPPPTLQTYEAESPSNTLLGNTSVISVVSCSACSGGEKVWYIGMGNALQFNMINVAVTRNYELTFYYCTDAARFGYISIDGGQGIGVSFTSSGGFDIVGSESIIIPLNAGNNTIKFYNDNAYAPDLDKIVVSSY